MHDRGPQTCERRRFARVDSTHPSGGLSSMQLRALHAVPLLALALFQPERAFAQVSCASLGGVSLPDTTLQPTQLVAAGTTFAQLPPPAAPAGAPPQPANVTFARSFCRV